MDKPAQATPGRATSEAPALARLRVDQQIVAAMVEPDTRVLDVGCGDGALLHHLGRTKRVDGRGIELSQAGVNACVAQGLSVVQGDADTDLTAYPAGIVDYAILSQTLQATRNPDGVLRELARIARFAIVSFPNFGHWRVRWALLATGRMPMTRTLPDPWCASQNIHLCTVTDFLDLCRSLRIEIERSVAIDRRGQVLGNGRTPRLANLLAEQAVFLLRRS